MRTILSLTLVLSAIMMVGCGASKDEASSSAPVGNTAPSTPTDTKAPGGNGMQAAPAPTTGPTSK